MSLLDRIAEEREVNPDGTISCGVFIPLPYNLARLFPNKDHEDDSVPHITLLYVGDVSPASYAKMVKAVQRVARHWQPFLMKLDTYAEFHNPKGQLIPHMKPHTQNMETVLGDSLVSLGSLHADLRQAVERAGVEVSHTYGPDVTDPDPVKDFKAHATLAYLPAGSTYDGVKPKGNWRVTELECWGHEKYRVPLGAKVADQPKMSLFDRIMQEERPERSGAVKASLIKPTNKLPGGKGDKLKPKDVDSKELAAGIQHELEHTKDKEIAQEIALDHLAEDPKYYSKLKKIESWEGLVEVTEDEVVTGLEELERVVPCPKGKRRVQGTCKSVMTQVSGPGVGPRRRTGPVRVKPRPRPGPVRVSDIDVDITVDDLLREFSDFPNKYGSTQPGSNRSGMGTAPDVDPRPEQEKKDSAKGKKAQAKAGS